jgi:hypothetical protein
MSCNKLTDEQKIYVVERLAAYDGLTAIARGLKEKFGITISPTGVSHYNPERSLDLAQRWKDLFAETRKAYIDSTADIGFTNKPARLRRREAMMHKAWAAGQYELANEILDSIAKETGDPLGDKRRHEHSRSRGAPLTGISRAGQPQRDPARKAGRGVRKPRD